MWEWPNQVHKQSLGGVAIRDTSIPSDSARNTLSPLHQHQQGGWGGLRHQHNIYKLLDLANADNTINMPSQGNGGVMEGVIAGVGDQLPADIEAEGFERREKYYWIGTYVEVLEDIRR